MAQHLFQQRQKPDCPTVDRRMVNQHTAFLQHFFKMAVAQRVGCVPADANEHDVEWKAHSFGREHRLQAFSTKILCIV
jgi:hypothetical protein